MDDEKINDAYHRLVEVNSTLWDVEDKLREYEKLETFEEHFVTLARKVYMTNDKRFEIKNFINEVSGSELREQKSYEDYQKKDI